MPTPYHRFYRKHGTAIVAVVVVASLFLLLGYNAAVRTAQRQRASATCAQIQTLYDTIIQLVRANAQATGAFSPATITTLQRQKRERISACKKAP